MTGPTALDSAHYPFLCMVGDRQLIADGEASSTDANKEAPRRQSWPLAGPRTKASDAREAPEAGGQGQVG